MTAGRLSVHAYPSPIRHESRIFREMTSLSDAGVFSEIILIGTMAPDVAPEQSLGPGRRIVRLPVWAERLGRSRPARLLAVAEWWIRLWVYLRRLPVAVFSAHNLAALPVGIALKRAQGTRVVYATHELETERTGWSRLTVAAGRRVERWLIYQADAVFVVSDSIAEWYRSEYPGLEVHVVRNVPLAVDGRGAPGWTAVPLKARLGVPEHALLFLYQGVFGAGRGLVPLLGAFRSGPEDRHLVFLGFSDGGVEAALVAEAERHCPRIHVLPPVSASELARFSAGADVGVNLIEPVSLSNTHTVGNKIYEYLSAGIPVVASDFPDVRALINHYRGGWLVAPDGSDFAAVVGAISRDDVARAKAGLTEAWKELSWEGEAPRLVAVYRALADACPAAGVRSE